MSEENFNMQTPASVLAPKQQYLNLMMNSFYKFSELAASPEPTKQVVTRMSMLTGMMISYLPNPNERIRLNEFREEKLREASKLKTADERDEATFNASRLIVGELMELMDDVLAIVERQTIMKSVSASNNVLEQEYYPAGYTLDTISEEV
jgi:hypothetical protein